MSTPDGHLNPGIRGFNPSVSLAEDGWMYLWYDGCNYGPYSSKNEAVAAFNRADTRAGALNGDPE